jgi:hypothetical protein
VSNLSKKKVRKLEKQSQDVLDALKPYDDPPNGAASIDLFNAMTLEQLYAPQRCAPLPAIAWTLICYALDEFMTDSPHMFSVPTDGSCDHVLHDLSAFASDAMRACAAAAVGGIPVGHPFRQHVIQMNTDDGPVFGVERITLMSDGE